MNNKKRNETQKLIYLGIAVLGFLIIAFIIGENIRTAKEASAYTFNFWKNAPKSVELPFNCEYAMQQNFLWVCDKFDNCEAVVTSARCIT